MALVSDGLKMDLLSDMSLERVFQKHIIDGASYFFRDARQRIDEEYQFRHELADALDVSINDIIIVGSAKMGFSIKTNELIPFDGQYLNSRNRAKRSDLDIAVVNKDLFGVVTKDVFSLSRRYDAEWIRERWRLNQFYSDASKITQPIFRNYCKYVSMGWLRPDFLPLDYQKEAPWNDVVDSWRKMLDYRKISIGIYSEWFYLKNYQIKSLEILRDNIMEMNYD
ncbi:hypothetical protein ACK3YM_17250 [Aeromonas caviae]